RRRSADGFDRACAAPYLRLSAQDNTAAAAGVSQGDVEPVLRDLPAGRLERGALGRAGAQHGVGVVDVDEELALDAEIGERRHRAVAPGDAQMPHAVPGLAAEAGLDHL